MTKTPHPAGPDGSDGPSPTVGITVGMEWHLRTVMASRGLFQTSELVPLLAARGVHLSREHVYRLVTRAPQRLNVEVLAALCDALDCQPNDLLTPTITTARAPKPAITGGPKVGTLRPIRANVRKPSDTQ